MGGPLRDEELPYVGEIYAMYVKQEYQKRGIGKALITRLAAEFHREDWNDFLIWCLLKNPSCGFYEKMNGKHQESKKIRIGDKPLIQHGYVFETEDFLKKEKEDFLNHE